MTINAGLLSNSSNEWRTPPSLFHAAEDRWGPFSLDAAATRENTLCENYCSLDQSPMNEGNMGDALTVDWWGRVWLNPPYGHAVGLFVRKALEQVGKAQRVIMLLPARTDTRWWQECIRLNEMNGIATVYFLPGRIRFSDSSGSPAAAAAPFPSAIVVFELPFSYSSSSSSGGT